MSWSIRCIWSVWRSRRMFCILLIDNMVLSAEMRWLSFLAKHDISMNTSTDIGPLFATMFSDLKFVQQFFCWWTKATYLLSDGIQPALTQSLITKLKQSSVYSLIKVTVSCVRSLSISLLSSSVKTLQIYTCQQRWCWQNYWCHTHSSHWWWHSVDQLILQIMSDSPNVMTVRFKGVLGKIKSQYTPHLLDIMQFHVQ